jgi:hypothetical protein
MTRSWVVVGRGGWEEASDERVLKTRSSSWWVVGGQG